MTAEAEHRKPRRRRTRRTAAPRRPLRRRSAPAVVAAQAPELPPGLAFQLDCVPGIRRRKVRGGFRYVSSTGRPVRDGSVLRRIRALAIPPAWSDVWISRLPQGHIQATGRDARGRKQYRYHPRWREMRDEAKFEHTAAFAEALPRLRKRIQQDFQQPKHSKPRVIAAIVRLLALTLIRVGNDEYARDNGSFGLTTLRRRHVKLEGSTVCFEFRGKSGRRHRIVTRDRRLANVLRECSEMRGRYVFQYVNGNGVPQRVRSADVNHYLRDALDGDFTAKDFRTWAGTVLAAVALSSIGPGDSQRESKRNVARAIEAVAEELGNTPAVCRKSYVHPAVIDAYACGELKLKPSDSRDNPVATKSGLSRTERAVLRVLRSQA